MESPHQRVVIPGSERAPLSQAAVRSPAPLSPHERLLVTVRVRPKTPLAAWASTPEMTDQPPQARAYFSREELARQLGAAPADMAQVAEFAQAHHLAVVYADAAARSVQLAGTAADFGAAFGGQDSVIGGTSAVAPLWAGLLARLNQGLPKPVGLLNPLLYGSLAGRTGLQDITVGTNGAYPAAPGWDACTGWGSPDGAALLAALQGGGKPVS